MVKVGKFNSLMVIKEVPFGVYLDGQDLGEILLPKKYVPKDIGVGDMVHVFLYFDSEDKIIATTQKPFIELNTCAFLKVIDINPTGVFLDWGLDKDLYVPRAEQHRPMEKDKRYIVYLKEDFKGRLIASSKVDHLLDKTKPIYCLNEEVNLLIAGQTELGFKVIIESLHWGLIHQSEVFKTLHYGQKTTGMIQKIREDGKIDVVLRKPAAIGRDELAIRILEALRKAGGFLPLYDKSSTEDIQLHFGESKKRFKNTIGVLYKQGEILIEPNGIRLISG